MNKKSIITILLALVATMKSGIMQMSDKCQGIYL